MDGLGRADQLLVGLEDFVSEGKRGDPDAVHRHLHGNPVAHKKRGLLSGLGMNDGKKIAFFADQDGKPEAGFF